MRFVTQLLFPDKLSILSYKSKFNNIFQSWSAIHELVNNECQRSTKWKNHFQVMNMEIMRIFVFKGSFTSNISQALKKQCNGGN